MALRNFGCRLASQPEQPREAGSPQQWPRRTNFLRAKSQSFPMYSRAKKQLIPGRAAAALPAKLAKACQRVCRCFFTHSFKPLLSGGLGIGAGALPPPPVSASRRVEIAMPRAVKIDAMVIPCSRNRVRMRSASVVSSWRSRLNVSRILLIWNRRVALFVERASILACFSSFDSKLSSFLIRSQISFCISVSSVSVTCRCSRARCLSTLEFRSSILVYSSALPGCLPTHLSLP